MLETIEAQFTESLAAFIAFLPNLAGGLALLLVGWLLARLLKLATRGLADTLNRLLDKLPRSVLFDYVRIPRRAGRWLGSLVFWVTLILFATAAIRVMGLTGVAQWLEQLVIHLPAAVAGAVVIIVGIIAAGIVRKVVTHTAESAGLVRAPFLGLMAQSATVTVALVIGLDQLGLDVTFLVLLVAIVLAAVLAGFSLAFGLGARQLVADLVATHHLRHFLRTGQQVRVGDTEGRLLEFAANGLVVETEEGRCLVPGARCLAGNVTVIAAGDGAASKQPGGDHDLA